MTSSDTNNNNDQRSSDAAITASVSGEAPAVSVTRLGDNGRAAIRETSELTDLCQCNRCKSAIRDKFVYKVLDACFHERCLQCNNCEITFSRTCFIRNRTLYCREHFRLHFGPKCSRCAQSLDESTIVRKANGLVYHVACFQCVICKRELTTGDQFYLIPMDGRLVCRTDYENAAKESEMDNSNKRPRTTISAKSLETLKQAYQTSSKPARHIREQLAAETGLDMRVVQVWFQNRRAKEKRLKKDAGRRWTTDTITSNGFSKTFDSDSGSNDESLTGRSPLYGGHPYADTPNDLDLHVDMSVPPPPYPMPSSYDAALVQSMNMPPLQSMNGYVPPISNANVDSNSGYDAIPGMHFVPSPLTTPYKLHMPPQTGPQGNIMTSCVLGVPPTHMSPGNNMHHQHNHHNMMMSQPMSVGAGNFMMQ